MSFGQRFFKSATLRSATACGLMRRFESILLRQNLRNGVLCHSWLGRTEAKPGGWLRQGLLRCRYCFCADNI
jgi:hypothetical protein